MAEGYWKFVRKGLICQTIMILPQITNETISQENIINNKNWIIFSVYRPPK